MLTTARSASKNSMPKPSRTPSPPATSRVPTKERSPADLGQAEDEDKLPLRQQRRDGKRAKTRDEAKSALQENKRVLKKQLVAVILTEDHNNSVLISNHKNTVQTDRFRVVAHSVQPHETCPRSHRNSVRVGTMNQGVTRSTPDTKTRESGPNRRKTTGNRS